MTKEIKVIDYLMGTGKTTYIFDEMQQHVNKKYMYVTPLLSEAQDRATSTCASINLKTPSDEEYSKSDSLLELLKEGANISTTHALFKLLRTEHIELIRSMGYTIILDEVIDYIQPYDAYSKDDLTDLFERGDLTVDEDNLGKVSMNWNVSTGNHYKDLYNVCSVGMLYSTKQPKTLLNIQIPPVMLDAAKEVIVLTYMFDSSAMAAFFKLRDYKVTKLIVPLLAQREREVKSSLKERLEFVEIKAADKITSAFRDTSLSHSWWDKAIKEDYAKGYMKVISNWIINNPEVKDSFYFCTPKAVVEKKPGKALLERYKIQYFVNTSKFTDLKGRPTPTPRIVGDEDEKTKKAVLATFRYPKWLPVSTKATNNYADRKLCLCLQNIYPNVEIQFYLQDYSDKIDNDKYALAEVLQFIWRGCIRNPEGENMKLYMGSPRMKRLVQEWLSI